MANKGLFSLLTVPLTRFGTKSKIPTELSGSVVSMSACPAGGHRFKPYQIPGLFLLNIHFKSM